MLSAIFKKLKFVELLAASEVCKLWRVVSLPIIADSVYLKIKSMDQTVDIFNEFSVNYKHFIFTVCYLVIFVLKLEIFESK